MHTAEATFVSLAATLAARPRAPAAQPVGQSHSALDGAHQAQPAPNRHPQTQSAPNLPPEAHSAPNLPPEAYSVPNLPPEGHSVPNLPPEAHSVPEQSKRAYSLPEEAEEADSRPQTSELVQSSHQPEVAHSADERFARARSKQHPASRRGGSEPTDREALVAGYFPDQTAAVREARLFRAALADAFEARLAQLLSGLADEVLGRELSMAAVDIEAVARRLVAERAADGPLRLRVSSKDSHMACDLPVISDPDLQPGDAVLECRSGDIDARLRVRLKGALTAGQR